MNKILLVLLCSILAASGATVTGPISGVSAVAYSPRVEFWPQSTPFLSGSNTVVGTLKAVQARDGDFSTTLAAGRYVVKFPPSADYVNIFVPDNTNTYTLAQLATNIFRVLTVDEIAGLAGSNGVQVAAGDNVTLSTNGTVVTINAEAGSNPNAVTNNDVRSLSFTNLNALSFPFGSTAINIQAGDDDQSLDFASEGLGVVFSISSASNAVFGNIYGSGAGLTSIPTNAWDATAYEWVSGFTGGGISASTATNIVNQNNALTSTTATNWLGMTNYTGSYAFRNTNTLTVASFVNTPDVNGDYIRGVNSWTNGSIGIYLDSGDNLYYMTNSGGFLYATLNGTVQPSEWEDFGGGGTPGTAYFPTNTATPTSYRSAAPYFVDFPLGATGTIGLFGTRITNLFGAQQNLSGTVYDPVEFPNGAIGAADISFNGATKSTGISAHRGTILGDSVSVISSALFDIACTNADLSMIASEFARVRNGNGVSSFINVLSFDDDSSGASYSFLNAAVVTNRNANFSTFLGTGSSTVGATFLLNTEGSWLGHYGNSTNSGLNNSVMLGQSMITTNTVRSTLIGRTHRTSGATNVYLFGEGLGSTSNNVAKIGFTGAHLHISSNGIVANGVGFVGDGSGLTNVPGSGALTNGYTGPTFNQSVSITNLNTGGSAIISATAPDDIGEAVTDTISFNPSGVASGGAYPGWVIAGYPLFVLNGFVGQHFGDGSGISNVTATVTITNNSGYAGRIVGSGIGTNVYASLTNGFTGTGAIVLSNSPTLYNAALTGSNYMENLTVGDFYPSLTNTVVMAGADGATTNLTIGSGLSLTGTTLSDDFTTNTFSGTGPLVRATNAVITTTTAARFEGGVSFYAGGVGGGGTWASVNGYNSNVRYQVGLVDVINQSRQGLFTLVTGTNGYILPQLTWIPTNNIPASTSAITNFVLMNLTNTVNGGGIHFVATNVAAAGSFILRKVDVTEVVWP